MTTFSFVRSRFASPPPDPEFEALLDYLVGINCECAPGTESGLFATFGHYLVTKADTPLIERVDFSAGGPDGSEQHGDIPVISFYGDADWMDRQGGAYIGDIGVIAGCTHHMHLEYPRLVTRCIMYFVKHNVDNKEILEHNRELGQADDRELIEPKADLDPNNLPSGMLQKEGSVRDLINPGRVGEDGKPIGGDNGHGTSEIEESKNQNGARYHNNQGDRSADITTTGNYNNAHGKGEETPSEARTQPASGTSTPGKTSQSDSREAVNNLRSPKLKTREKEEAARTITLLSHLNLGDGKEQDAVDAYLEKVADASTREKLVDDAYALMSKDGILKNNIPPHRCGKTLGASLEQRLFRQWKGHDATESEVHGRGKQHSDFECQQRRRSFRACYWQAGNGKQRTTYWQAGKQQQTNCGQRSCSIQRRELSSPRARGSADVRWRGAGVSGSRRVVVENPLAEQRVELVEQRVEPGLRPAENKDACGGRRRGGEYQYQ